MRALQSDSSEAGTSTAAAAAASGARARVALNRNPSIVPNPATLSAEHVSKLNPAQLHHLMLAVQKTKLPMSPALASAVSAAQMSGRDVVSKVTAQPSPKECDSGYASIGSNDTPVEAKSSSPVVSSLAGASHTVCHPQPLHPLSSRFKPAISHLANEMPPLEHMHSYSGDHLQHSSHAFPAPLRQVSAPGALSIPQIAPLPALVKEEPPSPSYSKDQAQYSNNLQPKLEAADETYNFKDSPHSLHAAPRDSTPKPPCSDALVHDAPHLLPQTSKQQETNSDESPPMPRRSTASRNSLGAIEDMIAEARVPPQGDRVMLVNDVTKSIIDAHMDTCIWTEDKRLAAFRKYDEIQAQRRKDGKTVSFLHLVS